MQRRKIGQEEIDFIESNASVEVETGCRIWKGNFKENIPMCYGYVIRRLLWGFYNGKPQGKIGVICHNRSCIYSGHLIDSGKGKGIPTYHPIAVDLVRGSSNGNSKLSEDEVKSIRAIYKIGNITYRRLAKRYDVEKTTICKIINRKLWAHLD